MNSFNTVPEALLLIFLLLVCHYLGDFVLAANQTLQDAKSKGKPFLPILVHSGIHAGLMLLVLLLFLPFGLCFHLFLIQLFSHFLIDVLKGLSNQWNPDFRNPTKYAHWLVFGFDQLLHQSVIILMVTLAWKGMNY